jgi:polyhydroxybutyrate depolymerase
MRWIVLVSIFFLLVSCAPEKSLTAPTGTAFPSVVTPVVISEVTTEVMPAATASPTSTTVTANCARGDYTDEIESGGQTRQYLLHVPATVKPEEPSALVLVFHGAGISAERFVNYTRFSNVADREGFLIVYPQGQGPKEEAFWDTSAGSRDVQFVSDLIDHLQIRCNVDPNRIYATGHSNGGGMVNRLACDLADRIAAIGPVSGAYSSGGCSPSRPIPVFAIHGTGDNIVSYNGIPDWASVWAERNGCDPEPIEIPHNVLIGEKQWQNCDQQADVVLYTIQDLDHTWTHDIINFGQTIWEFFEQHPMNSSSP